LERQLFFILARAIEQRIGDFKAQELTNTVPALAFVIAGHLEEAQLFMVLVRASEQSIGDFKAKGLANTA